MREGCSQLSYLSLICNGDECIASIALIIVIILKNRNVSTIMSKKSPMSLCF